MLRIHPSCDPAERKDDAPTFPAQEEHSSPDYPSSGPASFIPSVHLSSSCGCIFFPGGYGPAILVRNYHSFIITLFYDIDHC